MGSERELYQLLHALSNRLLVMDFHFKRLFDKDEDRDLMYELLEEIMDDVKKIKQNLRNDN